VTERYSVTKQKQCPNTGPEQTFTHTVDRTDKYSSDNLKMSTPCQIFLASGGAHKTELSSIDNLAERFEYCAVLASGPY
jgi:hypothetical protein